MTVRGSVLAELTWLEAEKVLTREAIVVLPLGAAAKEHGPHLRLDNDLRMADGLVRRVLASLDEIGYGATLFTRPVNSQAELVKALQGRDYFPVQMGELPHLQRPGEARTAELKAKKKKKRRWPR